LIAAVDEFILYDDMQYTRRDWCNRNQIKTPHVVQWLTVPVRVKGRYYQTIRETEIEGSNWTSVHWKTLVKNYHCAPYFDEIAVVFESLYLKQKHTYLSTLNRVLIEAACGYMGITTKISNSWDHQLIEGKTERQADLCFQAGGIEYISGLAAKDYIKESLFTERGIKLSWFDYNGYPEYDQLWGPFIHQASIIDLLSNASKSAPEYIRFAINT